MEWILYILVVPLLLGLIIAKEVYSMSRPERVLKPDLRVAEVIARKMDQDAILWINENDCQFVNSYRFLQVVFAVWKFPDGGPDILVYLAGGKIAYDVSTSFEDHKSLVTTTSGDAFLFPEDQGEYKEVLQELSLEELYAAHLSSLVVLRAHGGYVPHKRTTDFDDYLKETLRTQMLYVRSHVLWPLRASYWFFVRRLRMRGITIEQQLRRGLTK